MPYDARQLRDMKSAWDHARQQNLGKSYLQSLIDQQVQELKTLIRYFEQPHPYMDRANALQELRDIAQHLANAQREVDAIPGD